jgi:hypothetical protein
MAINLQEEYNNTNIQSIIDQLDNDLVGLAPVKQRIKEIAALLLVQRLRKKFRPRNRISRCRFAYVLYRESRNWKN